MATLTDIANALGLNKTTVSKALNGSSDISESTKEKVLGEARRIGYVKHEKKLKEKARKQLIGIICPELTSYYYSQLVTGLSDHLHAKAFRTIVALSDFSAEREKECLQELVSLNVCGLIVITEESDIARTIASVPNAQQLPIVVIGLNCTSREYDTVSVDEGYAVQQITDYLLSLGHQKFAFIGDKLVNSRLNYLIQQLERRNIPLNRDAIILLDKRNEECGYECMNRLLTQENRPTAVVAGYDTIALGAYRALTEHGLSIPEDLSLISFDDASFSQYLPCAMTTVSYDAASECKVAAAILLSRIHEGDSTFKQAAAIIPKLIIRQSTGVCPAPQP